VHKEWLLPPCRRRYPLSGVDVFAGSQWNAADRIGRGRRSSAAFPALGRAADAQKRVPTPKYLHLRGFRLRQGGRNHLFSQNICTLCKCFVKKDQNVPCCRRRIGLPPGQMSSLSTPRVSREREKCGKLHATFAMATHVAELHPDPECDRETIRKPLRFEL